MASTAAGRRWLAVATAAALTIGVGWVGVDAARRAFTLGVFTEGHGEPVKSPPEAFRAAEWNVIYLLGLAVGVGAGVGASAAGLLWWRVARGRGR